ncbi:arylsulfatase [Jiangella asiatica]|uniref:Arylsulfatase n=1 Tax=Jiangella asiatica TaxID=2530372 RepID=A0A4R5DJH8_9ACTN|nr:arylsulfatase [Jiangella asiatica]TDE14292.1 arylsulfatase [Jiangella asiatica]
MTTAATPNVVMIVLDDLGFADLGCYGSEIDTPNIDRLASGGLRYTGFHVTAVCSASRASILTGRNHHNVGMGFLTMPMHAPGYTARIPRSAATLPRVLRDGGYNTFAVGKWHLTPQFDMGPDGPFDRWPLGMGFERYYGFLGGLANQWTPDLVRDNSFVEPPGSFDDGYHLTEDLTSEAIRMVLDQQNAAPGKPFFLYLAPGATHFPHHVPQEWIDRYRGRFDDGWERCRERTFGRQVELGIVPEGTTLAERPSWVDAWDELTGDDRILFARQMEVYAGFLSHTDAQIGRLLDFLAELEVLDDTVVMLMSDNGASADGGPHGAIGPENYFEANPVESMIAHLDDIGGPRTFNHYSWGWAWAGNTPFRLWKHYTWLGGVRVPLIVRWPGGIGADGGGVRTQFCHAIDLMPTVLQAARLDAPPVVDGVDQQAIDGSSFLDTLDDPGRPSSRTTQYFEMMSSRAIYHDGWKATTNHVLDFPAQRRLLDGSTSIDADEWSLYDLSRDFAEAHDVADEYPEVRRRLVELWWYEAGRNQVLPLLGGLHDRLAVIERPPSAERTHWTYRAGGAPIPLPSLTGGFRLVAVFEVVGGPAATGVICAQGDVTGGWSCYLLEGRPVVTFKVGSEVTTIAAPGALGTGRHDLELVYRPQPGDAAYRLSVRVDGDDVGSEALTSARRLSMAAGKLLIGRDTGVPVSDDYRAPFPLTGRVHSVSLDLLRMTPEDQNQDVEFELVDE